MNYRSLQECVADLRKNGHLVRIKGVNLEMGSGASEGYLQKMGRHFLFEKVKGSRYMAVVICLVRTIETNLCFANTFHKMQEMVGCKQPLNALRKPF